MANFQPQLSAEQLNRQQAYNRELERSNHLAGELNRTLAERGTARALETSTTQLQQTTKGLKQGADYWRRSFSAAAKIEEQAALQRSEQQFRLHQERLRQVESENRAQVQGAEQASARLQRGGQTLFSKWSAQVGRLTDQLALSSSHRKTDWAQTGQSVGGAMGGMFFGPWGGVAGAAIGGKLGQVADQSNQSGALSQKMDRLGEAFARLNERALEFEQSLALSSMSTAGKSDQYEALQGQQGALDKRYESRRAQQETELERLKEQLSGSNNRRRQDRLEKQIDQLEAKMRTESVDYQSERQELQEALQTYYEDLRVIAQGQKQEFKDSREAQRAYFAQMTLEEQGPQAMRANVERLHASLAAMGPIPASLSEQAVFFEKAAAMEQRKLEMTRGYIDQTQALLDRYQNLIDQVAQKAQDLARADWAQGDYLSELYRLEQEKQRLNPAALHYDKELLQLQQDQFSLLGQLEAAQREEVDQSKRIVETLESSEQSLAEKLLQMQTGALPAKEAFERLSEDYQSKLESALSARGDLRAPAVGEFLAGFDGYLDEARRVFRSGRQFQDLYGQMTGDLNRLLGSLGTEVAQINGSLSGSVDMQRLYAEFAASLKGNQQGIQNNLNRLIGLVAAGFNRDSLADLAGVIPHRADGGLVSGPNSGFLTMLHGTEAVIPLKNGPVPLVIQGPKGDSARMEALLAELIDVVRAKSDQGLVVLDTQGIRQEVVRQVSEDSRMGRLRLGAS